MRATRTCPARRALVGSAGVVVKEPAGRTWHEACNHRARGPMRPSSPSRTRLTVQPHNYAAKQCASFEGPRCAARRILNGQRGKANVGPRDIKYRDMKWREMKMAR